jgi:pimeloyl-ACP methyl ester carboxylesterase
MTDTVVLTDRTIGYTVHGTGDVTLLLAAGLGRPGGDLAPIADGVARAGIRAVTYDYRGIGVSTGAGDTLTLHDYAADVWAIVDALGAHSVHLAGKTFGNRVMRTASADHPDRVDSIVLLGAGGEIPPSPDVQRKYMRFTDPTIGDEEWAALQAELNFAPRTRHLAAAWADRDRYPLTAGNQMHATSATPPHEWLGGGTAPMLVVTGLQDIVAVPQNALNIALTRPGTRLVGLADCGHNMIAEQPDELVSLLVDHIRRHTRS